MSLVLSIYVLFNPLMLSVNVALLFFSGGGRGGGGVWGGGRGGGGGGVLGGEAAAVPVFDTVIVSLTRMYASLDLNLTLSLKF